jgi:hypothetical protein
LQLLGSKSVFYHSVKSTDYIKIISQDAIALAQRGVSDVSTAVITAEERLRFKLKTTGRTILASIFLVVSGLVSIGANLTPGAAIAKEKNSEKKSKRSRGHTRYKTSNDPFADIRSMNEVMVGVASWYGPGFHNKKTASGVKFDQNAMMAAHRTLPFGTIVRVTNINNSKSCFVKITDRGPFAKNRILDLSKAAAHELDFAHCGTAKVRMEVVSDDIASEMSTSLKQQIGVQDRLLPSNYAVR